MPSARHPLLFICLLPAFVCGQEARPLGSAAEVRRLSAEAAAERLPVSLEARVGFIDHPNTVFVQDDEAGTFFRIREGIETLRPGDLVHVEGVTHAGLYLTGVDDATFRVLGHGPPPPARAATYDDLASGRWHYQRVQVRGVIRRAAPLDENRAVLTVALGRQLIEARVDAALDDRQEWVDALVEIEGLAAGGINDRRQLVQPYLRVADWDQIRMVKPAPPPEAVPEQSAARLLRFQPRAEEGFHLHRVRLRGNVIAVFPDARVFLRDPATDPPAAFAATLDLPAPGLSPGDRVEIIGFPEMGGFSARISDARLLAAEPGDLPEPRATEVKSLASAQLDADLVRFTAQVVEQWRSADGTGWRLRDGDDFVQAFLPGGADLELQPGTQIAVTGICEVESASESGFRARPTRARLLLRAADDLQILRAPSWWTTRRLLGLVAALAALILAGLVWIGQLRRQVARQARTLRDRVAREAALDERHRIAREFHDTLEQELAGLSIRLGAVASRPLEDKAKQLLDTTQHLLSRVQNEARDLVHGLREPDIGVTDLAAALRELVDRQPADGPRCALEVTGPLPTLPPATAHHLRMIAQESLTNALKHAAASRVQIRLRVVDGALLLSVTDDGKGFEDNETTPAAGRFGRIGIRERCRKINATTSWRTAPGQGTEVHVRLPLEAAATPQPKNRVDS